MKNSISAIVAALAILANHGIAQESQAQKTTESANGLTTRTPVINKYDKMEKKQLQEELKRLLKQLPVVEETLNQAKAKLDEAAKTYETASKDEKPDAYLHKLEAQAKYSKSMGSLNQARSDFEAAKNAYINLIIAEEK